MLSFSVIQYVMIMYYHYRMYLILIRPVISLKTLKKNHKI